MEISRAMKFLLDRGATAFIKLYSTNYSVSPLEQSGVEIPSRVEIQIPPNLKSREITDLYKSFVVGLFLSTNEEIQSTLAPCSSSANKKKKIGKENSQEK